MTAVEQGPRGLLVVFWAVGGTVAILLRAVLGLGQLAVDALASDLTALHWAVLGAWTVFMAWSEGYRGFQKQFSPRVVKRALHLARHPRPLHVLVGPLYAMGLVHGTRRRLILSWGLTAMIVVMVLLVRMLPQPWRGIVDFGVVLGLVWGIVAIGWFLARALAGREPEVPAEVPTG